MRGVLLTVFEVSAMLWRRKILDIIKLYKKDFFLDKLSWYGNMFVSCGCKREIS